MNCIINKLDFIGIVGQVRCGHAMAWPYTRQYMIYVGSCHGMTV